MSAVLAGPFPPWQRCGSLPYIQYGCESTPCPDAKFLADHSCQQVASSPNRGVQGAAPPVARRSGRNTRWPQPAKHPRRARREIPHRPIAPSADGAISAAYAARPPSPPYRGWRTAAFLLRYHVWLFCGASLRPTRTDNRKTHYWIFPLDKSTMPVYIEYMNKCSYERMWLDDRSVRQRAL